MSVILVNPITADSLRSALPDSIWIANFPEPSIAATMLPWVMPLLSAGIAATVTYRITRGMYERQKRDAAAAKTQAAFNLFWAICDEMRRARNRTWKIIELATQNQGLKSPIVTEAKDKLLGRLTELMPSGWEPHHVFRFYEHLALIAVHHNAAVEIPEVYGAESMYPVLNPRTMWGGRAPEDTVEADVRRQKSYRKTSIAFALHYFDPEGRDGMTEHYIAAIRQLKALGESVGIALDETLAEPTDTERAAARATIAAHLRANTRGR